MAKARRRAEAQVVLGIMVALSGCRRAARPSPSTDAGAASAPPPQASVPTASSSAPAAASGAVVSAWRPFAPLARLTAARPSLEEGFGQSVALDRARVLVGVPRRGQARSGGVDVFEREGEGYRVVQSLHSPVPTAYFGSELALVGGELFVSRPFPSGSEPPRRFGWREGAYASAGALAWPLAGRAPHGSHFGHTLASHGSQLLVAARGTYALPGRVFLLERGEDGALSLVHEFRSSEVPSADFYNFYLGHRASFDGETVVLGAIEDPAAESKLVTFRKRGDTWAFESQMPWPLGGFAVLGEVLLVGTEVGKGPVAVFRRQGDGWRRATELEAASQIAAEGDTVALSTGAVFSLRDGHLTLEQRLTRGGKAFSGQGRVALHDDQLAIGEPAEGGGGAVHVYARQTEARRAGPPGGEQAR